MVRIPELTKRYAGSLVGSSNTCAFVFSWKVVGSAFDRPSAFHCDTGTVGAKIDALS